MKKMVVMWGLCLCALIVSASTFAPAQSVRIDGISNPTFGQVTASCLDTGQGCNELFDMDQNVMSTSTPTFLGGIFDSNLLVNKNAIGATTTDGLRLINNTAAAAGAQQWSPRLRLSGNGWKTNATAASQAVEWRIEVIPVQAAANPTGVLNLMPVINGSDATAVTINSAGSLTSTNTIAASLFSFTGGIYHGGIQKIAIGAPGVSSCGDAALQTGSTDSNGRVVGTTQTGCVITFSAALGTNGADCLIQNSTTEGQGIAAASTTALTVAGLTAGDDFNYFCIGR